MAHHCEMCGTVFSRRNNKACRDGKVRDYGKFCSKHCYGMTKRLGPAFHMMPLSERVRLVQWWADIMRVRQLLGVSKTWVKSVCR